MLASMPFRVVLWGLGKHALDRANLIGKFCIHHCEGGEVSNVIYGKGTVDEWECDFDVAITSQIISILLRYFWRIGKGHL